MADAMGDIVSSHIEDRAVIEHAANAKRDRNRMRTVG
jgi:hypothetical protein